MKLPGKALILMGLILLITDGFVFVQCTKFAESTFGIIVMGVVALIGTIYPRVGSDKYMIGE